MFVVLVGMVASLMVEGALTTVQVAAEVEPVKARVRRCSIDNAAALPSQATPLQMRWRVAGDGTSTDVVVVSEPPPPAIAACVVAAIADVRFAKSDGTTVVTERFTFVRSLSKSGIAAVVKAAFPAIRDCYERQWG
ncbi:MAG TPA: hypothetical protein VGF99_21045, partial [Myxococcota bacterium]